MEFDCLVEDFFLKKKKLFCVCARALGYSAFGLIFFVGQLVAGAVDFGLVDGYDL